MLMLPISSGLFSLLEKFENAEDYVLVMCMNVMLNNRHILFIFYFNNTSLY